MHLISKLHISNFRSIRDSKFELSNYSPFVGYNNGGKSNVLRALSWLLKKSNLAESDFYNPEIPVCVIGFISGITQDILENLEEKHRNRISPYVVNESIFIRRIQLHPAADTKGFSFDLKKGDDSGDWTTNPTGIDNAITEIFPEPIVIAAMQDAAEDVAKFGKSTTIGQILSQIMGPVRSEQNAVIEQALSGVRDQLSANAANKNQQLRDIDGIIDNEVKKFFPGVSVKTHIPVPHFDDFLKAGTVKIFEDNLHQDDQGRTISTMGHGSQRAIQMALINCLAVVKRENIATTTRTTLLLIDEPELYLHPQAIERVRIALKALSNNNYQVLFTTHSAHMISREDAENVVLIRRDADRGTFARPTIATAIKQAIANADHQAETLFSLTHSTKIFFADSVLLAEGKTEKKLLPKIFETATSTTLEEKKIALIEVGGSGNIASTKKILEYMGLPVKAIVDLDFAFKEATKHSILSPSCDKIAACKVIMRQLEESGELSLSNDGLPTQGVCSAETAYERLARNEECITLIQELHNDLKVNNIWVWKAGAIEPHLGLTAKTNSEWARLYRTIQDARSLDFIPNAPIIHELCEWLSSE